MKVTLKDPLTMVGPPIRKTHSARARKSRKKGKGERQQADIHFEKDTNVDILVPKSNEDKDKQRKEQLLQEVSASFRVPRHPNNRALSAYFPIGVYVDLQEKKEVGEVYRTLLIRYYFDLQIYLTFRRKK